MTNRLAIFASGGKVLAQKGVQLRFVGIPLPATLIVQPQIGAGIKTTFTQPIMPLSVVPIFPAAMPFMDDSAWHIADFGLNLLVK